MSAETTPWRALLPTSLTICGAEYEIRSDYRAVLDILTALTDPELEERDKTVTVLDICYPDFDTMPPEHYQEAIERCFWFIDCGDDRKGEAGVKLMDWEQDFKYIVAPINRVTGMEVRSAEYLHWWTFLAAYYEIGDCLFAQIIRIRDRLAHGKPLDKGDRDWYRKNRALVTQQLAAAGSASKLMGGAIQRAGKSLGRFSSRLKEVVRSALIFTLITQALAKFRNWMGKVVESNAQASAAVAQLNGALLTLAQPLVGVIIPAFTAFVNVLTRIVVALARVMSMIFGTTVEQSAAAAEALDKETDALGKTGAAAKKAGKSLAGFDELNKLSDTSGGGGGGAPAVPSFDFDNAAAVGDFDKILNVVKLIGAALLAWKLSDGFKEGLIKFAGLFLAIDGAIGLAKLTFDAWMNGVSWDDFFTILLRAAELVAGLWIALGKVAAGVGLVLAGITMLVTAFHDADVNGWNLQNTLLAITGILSAGLGIALFTGSWIPLLLAGIAAALLAIVTAFGDGEKLIADAKLILQGFLDFFVGIFTGDIGRAMKGIGEIFDGLKGIAGNVLDSVKKMFIGFLDWLDEKTGGQFTQTIQFIKDLIGGTTDWMKESFGIFADAFQEILEGITTFLSGVFTGDWDKAWDGLVGIGRGAVNLLTGMVESFVNFFINGLNALVGALNRIKFTAPDWVPAIGGKTYGVNIPLIPKMKIPRLATGAVIPPNREFMAVLGDQHSGTNIETPEGLLRQLFREESGNAAVVSALHDILDAIRDGKVLMVGEQQLAAVVSRAVASQSRARGVAMIPI